MSGRVKDRTGQRFGRLIVLGDAGERDRKGQVVWLCLCDCGQEHRAVGGNLQGGSVRSCGCLQREASAQRGRARKRPPKICIHPGCSNTIEKGAWGYCGKHAQRIRRYGDPNFVTPEEVRRRNSREAQRSRFAFVKPSTYRKYLGRHEHRVVAERTLGRPLRSDEHVHHRDEDKHNNAPENLEVMPRLQHLLHHARQRRRWP